MSQSKVYTVIGLMSGTSLDGIDAALIRTDGRDIVESLGFYTKSYDPALRDRLRACLKKNKDTDGSIAGAAEAMTRAHADAVAALLKQTGKKSTDIDMIGFHGQTLFHDPANRFTWQIGDGNLLAELTGIDVVNDFRTTDVKAGGQGAPLLPVYHAALTRAAKIDLPVAILNIGGVSNVTYIGDDIVAFDTGPGNALIDDAVVRNFAKKYDEDGKIALSGYVHQDIVLNWFDHPFFAKKPPKSLDRDAWDIKAINALIGEDQVATLTAFTIGGVARAVQHLPQPPKAWYVTGGGRHNGTIMQGLRDALQVPVKSVDELGWNGDAVEAEGFAYMAVRSRLGLPISFPGTTGCPVPMAGGVFHPAKKRAA